MQLNLSPSKNALLDGGKTANVFNGKQNTSRTLTVHNAGLPGRAGPI